MVKLARILILDFNRSSNLSIKLKEILGSSSSTSIHYTKHNSSVSDLDLNYRDTCSTILNHNSDIIFISLDNNLIKRVKLMIQFIRKEIPQTPILLVVDDFSPNEMLELLKLGLNDFITAPLKSFDILPRVWRLLEQTLKRDNQVQYLKEKLGLKQIVGASPAFVAEIKKIPIIAKCDAKVMISGETGTGKELFARAVHYLSPRAGKPFIPVNCGAIPEELMENELFGHERGAFTGASTSKPGLIKEADGGTLFLDEIDCLSLSAQVKLLRFLQEKEYRPLGSPRILKADVRVIAATNVDLEIELTEGKFRRDLYYRLNIITLKLPPLRERPEDISLLANHFLAKYAEQYNKQVNEFSSDVLRNLLIYDWPGNVRELEHAIERAVVLCQKEVIESTEIIPGFEIHPIEETFKEAKARFVARFEKNYIMGLLVTYRGNISKAARAAKKNRRAFWQLMRKHRINV